MTRQERIELNKRLGFDTKLFERMTDEQYESLIDFLNEKELKKKRP